MPRCGGSTPSRTSSTGISRRSRGTGCGQACREGGAPLAAGACGRVLLDGGGGHQGERFRRVADRRGSGDRKSTRLNSSHGYISYAVFCLKKKKTTHTDRALDEIQTHRRSLLEP